MKAYLIFYLLVLTSLASMAQVGIGTQTPTGNLEVTSGDSSDMGMVIPIVARVSDVRNPQGGAIREGTIVFEQFNNTLCFYRNSQWMAINPSCSYQPGQYHQDTSYQRYVKAINPDAGDHFGRAAAISRDGNTLVVGVAGEDDLAFGVTSPNGQNALTDVGATYVYIRSGNTWVFQQYIKATNAWMQDNFGFTVALSADGNTLAVGATGEDDGVSGVTTPDGSNSVSNSGAVYIYVRSGSTWSFQQYIKAINPQAGDLFSYDIDLSDDGNTLAVGAINEADSSSGVTTPDGNNTTQQAGAVYIYTRAGSTWSFQQYIKAINTGMSDMFGYRVSLSADGNTLAVSAHNESDTVAGVTTPDDRNTAHFAGAAYIYVRSGSTWSFQQYIKAINPQANDNFGIAVDLSGDGNTLAVSSTYEGDDVSGVTNPDGSNSAWGSGAVYIYRRSAGSWSFEQYIKAVNQEYADYFGFDLSLSNNGDVLVVGAPTEDGAGTGICIPDLTNSAKGSGAAYVYRRNGSTWTFDQYIKAINTGGFDEFGSTVNMSGDGAVLFVTAHGEDDNQAGVTYPDGGNTNTDSGAAYILE